jgi:hypothetical protein
MRKYVPAVLPWFLPSAMFSVVVAAVHSWKADSLQFALLFVGETSLLQSPCIYLTDLQTPCYNCCSFLMLDKLL